MCTIIVSFLFMKIKNAFEMRESMIRLPELTIQYSNYLSMRRIGKIMLK